MPSNRTFDPPASYSGSSAGHDSNHAGDLDEVVVLPVAPIRNHRVNRRRIPGTTATGHDQRISTRFNFATDSMPSSPGEIISQSFNTDEHRIFRNNRRTDEEKYRDLNAADLVIVIDTQQTLLDRLNHENQELQRRLANFDATLGNLLEENDRLRAILSRKLTHENLDQLIDQSIIDYSKIVQDRTEVPAECSRPDRDLTESRREKQTLLQEIAHLENELKTARSDLTETTQKLAEVRQHLNVKGGSKYHEDLEELVESLGSTIKDFRNREEKHLTETLALTEENGRFAAESKRLREVAQQAETLVEDLRVQHARDLKRLGERYEMDVTAIRKSYTGESRDVNQALNEAHIQIKELATALQSERAKLKIALEDHAILASETTDKEIAASASIHKLTLDLSSSTQQLALAVEFHEAEKERSQLAISHHIKQHRLDENHIAKLKQRLTNADADWTKVNQDNARLSTALVELERITAEQSKAKPVVKNDTITTWHLKQMREKINTMAQFQINTLAESGGDAKLADLIDIQTNLMGRFKIECEILLKSWVSSEKSRQKLLRKSRSYSGSL